MAYNPRLRDHTWKQVIPGCYLDPEGAGHIFPDEICAEFGWPHTEENHNLIIQVYRQMMARECPGAPLVTLKHQWRQDA